MKEKDAESYSIKMVELVLTPSVAIFSVLVPHVSEMQRDTYKDLSHPAAVVAYGCLW